MVEVERDGVLALVPAAWEPPSWPILPNLLAQARTVLDATLAPAGPDGVREIMLPLMLVTKARSAGELSKEAAAQFFAMRAAEYERHLVEVPLDLLKEASDKCAVESEFFPTVAELFKHIRPELEKRRRMSDRLNRLLSRSAQPSTPTPRRMTEAEQRAAHIAKLREGIAVCRKHNRTATAARWECELAKLEGREPEAWASDAAPVAAPTSTPSRAPGFTKAGDAFPRRFE